MTPPVIVWFRRDLRLADNPALQAALALGRPVIPVYILGSEPDLGGALRWWLHHGLMKLAEDLAARGSRLILRRGDPTAVIEGLIEETGATALYWNRCYDGLSVARDGALKEDLRARGLDIRSFNGSLLFEPWTIRNKQDRPYQVFSQFWKSCRAGPAPATPLPAPERLPEAATHPVSDILDDWNLRPSKPDWAGGLRESWVPGEAAAAAKLHEFLDERLQDYKNERDRPDLDSTSSLSPYLRWGEISPRQIWHAAMLRRDAGGSHAGTEKFLAELGWREFSYSLLFHNPEMTRRELRPAYADFPWQPDAGDLARWQRGQTGYPLVDAGMRQLWHTGWMHNRVRMVTASFLVKHLLQPWQAGERWFYDCLVDADPASNAASWQWVAGCGADAAPYFRIFNPILQGAKFDPDGAYVRRWVPELRHRSNEVIHQPATGIAGYPGPMIDHDAARQRALAALSTLSGSATGAIANG